MQTCLVVSGPAQFAALAFKDSLEKGVQCVADLGFDAVELAIRDPEQVDASGLKTLLQKLGLPVVAIGTGQAYGEEGLSFTDPRAEVRWAAIERVKKHIDLAAKLDAMVIIGLIRGRRVDGVTQEQAVQWLLEALCQCAGHAVPQQVRLVLEPINRYETNLLNTVAETMDLIRQSGCSNIGILYDTFHANIEEADMHRAIREAGQLLWHVHTADSNRWAPGFGHLDFTSLVVTLRGIGYRGALSAEILPLPDPESSARQAREFLKKLTRSH
ncbi:MAG: 5-keto-L-gluconate epimerase [Bacillota bacterium]|uniref:5-keto-L-gluconate epimerase n=1 Tax=Desulfurispora thermophila TaxID=265470 RepID=UPI00035D1EC1|nr:5-keto-L-gluconate epimerase [Desulfurispora thermophila]